MRFSPGARPNPLPFLTSRWRRAIVGTTASAALVLGVPSIASADDEVVGYPACDSGEGGDVMPIITNFNGGTPVTSIAVGDKLALSVPGSPGSGYVMGTWADGQWYRDGGAVKLGNVGTYDVTAQDAGHSIGYAFPIATPGSGIPPFQMPGPAVCWVYTSTTVGVQGGTSDFAGTLAVDLSTTTPTVGVPVTATPSGLTPTPAGYDYQWKRDGVSVGTNSASYTPDADDVGKLLTVEVTAKTSGYNDKVESGSAGTVTKGNFAGDPGTPTIAGTAQVGEQLTATAHDGTLSPTPTGHTYQWYANGVAIDGATHSTFEPTSDQSGATITVKVTSTANGYNDSDEVESDQTDLVADGTLTTQTPTLSGSAVNGQSLTITMTDWSPTPVYSYQWYRRDGGVDTEISGATGSSYDLTGDDVGKKVWVKVTGTKDGYTTTDESSAYSGTVLAVFTAAPKPTVSGDAVKGEELTAAAGTWSPAADGFTYQWFADGDPIDGATHETFTPGTDQVGKAITVKVTGSKDGVETKTSDASTPTANVLDVFTTTPAPAISNPAPSVGDTLEADPGTWTPAVSGGDVSYQWYVDGTAVQGATHSTYQVAAGDKDKKITVKVTVDKAGFKSVTVESDQTADVVAGTLTGLATPIVSGEAKVGQTLTATGVTTGGGVTAHYKWYSGSTPITGATGESYTVAPDYLGEAITVEVTYSKAGYVDSVKTSEAKMVVKGDLDPQAAPGISGVAKVGEVLTATGLVEGLTPSLQWFVDGVAVEGATGATFVVAPEYLGRSISVGVSYSKDGYNETAQVVSEDTAEVVAGTLSGVAAPVVAGTAQVDETLTVAGQAGLRAAAFRRTVASASGVGVSYQWFVAGQPVAGATGTSYTAKAADLGRTVTVRATYTRAGYVDAVKESAATSPVAPGDWKVTAKTRIAAESVSAVGGTMTATDPTLSKTADGYRYQWFVNGTAIAGATGRSIVNDAAFTGELLTVRVTASRAGYPDVVSEATNIHRIGAFWITSKPGISGSVKAGSKVRAVTGGWAPAPTGYSYQWLIGGKKIAGATKSTYKVPAKYRGKKLQVKVTAKASGYTLDATRTSSAKVIR